MTEEAGPPGPELGTAPALGRPSDGLVERGGEPGPIRPVAEGAIVGLVGGAIGLLAGCAIAYRLLTVSWRTIAGFHMPIVWPFAPLVIGLLTAIITGALAGYVASRGAATGSIALRLSRQTAAG